MSTKLISEKLQFAEALDLQAVAIVSTNDKRAALRLKKV